MSTKNGHITTPPYISHVRLKGYKSIIDTKVDLHPGLNIIIGPNGSGKTNFLEFLEKILHVHFPPHNFHVSIEISHNNEVNIWEAKFHSQSNIGNYSIVEWYYSKGKKKPEKNIHHLLNDGYIQGHPSKYIEAMNFVGWKLSGNLIQFTMPHSIIGLNEQMTLSINKERAYIESQSLINSKSLEFIRMVKNFFLAPNIKKALHKKDKKALISLIELDVNLKNNLRKFSPITEIRIDEGISIKSTKLNYVIDYIGFEFLVNEEWLSWNMLSDGTKRLFYIISEVTLRKNGIFLIEEPELGLYPDQLMLILSFLKEQSSKKQIIITTHAPKTLDVIKDNELNRIIITKYDKEKGTLMRHLSKGQIKSIIDYKDKEGFTSDLWSMTDLFEEEVESL